LKLRHCQRPPNFWDPYLCPNSLTYSNEIGVISHMGSRVFTGGQPRLHAKGTEHQGPPTCAEHSMRNNNQISHVDQIRCDDNFCRVDCDLFVVVLPMHLMLTSYKYICIVESQRHRQLVKVLTWRTCTFASITLLFYLIA